MNQPVLKKFRVYLETFGCQMNDYDSARMLCLLKDIGFESTERPADADLILVNTCSVRDKAEQKALSRIGRLKKLKKHKPDLILGVTGCFAQRKQKDFLRSMPYLDLVLGTDALDRLPDHVKRLSAGGRPVVDVVVDHAHLPASVNFDDIIPGKGSPVSAFVTVMRGCNNFCAYCIVPYVRGRERSRPPGDILYDAAQLVDRGVREITLLGQNVNSYGAGLSPTVDFCDLLQELHEIDGLAQIRFTTNHPKDMSNRLIDAFTCLPKLAPHLHLALQAGSDRVLSLMNRGYTYDYYLDRVHRLRQARAGLAVTSDILVGFPGETEQDFQQTLAALAEVRFSNLFTFRYSVRPGTSAAELLDDVPEEEKISRLMKVQKLQRKITFELHRQLIGQNVQVLVEKEQTDPKLPQWSGKSGCYREVHFDGDDIRVGDMVTVGIEGAFANHLCGRAMKRSEPTRE